jgi:hypothetical protein
VNALTGERAPPPGAFSIAAARAPRLRSRPGSHVNRLQTPRVLRSEVGDRGIGHSATERTPTTPGVGFRGSGLGRPFSIAGRGQEAPARTTRLGDAPVASLRDRPPTHVSPQVGAAPEPSQSPLPQLWGRHLILRVRPRARRNRREGQFPHMEPRGAGGQDADPAPRGARDRCDCREATVRGRLPGAWRQQLPLEVRDLEELGVKLERLSAAVPCALWNQRS